MARKQRVNPARTTFRDHAVTATWAASEATAFFIVPDVWLSWVGLRNPRRALAATGSALGGAMVGGLATYFWGAKRGEKASRKALLRQPAISRPMINRIDHEMHQQGSRAMLAGPLRGAPYKIYARTAGVQRHPLHQFLLWTIPARMVRFLIVAGAAGAIGKKIRTAQPERAEKILKVGFFAFWILFYIWFFKTTGRETPAETAKSV